MGQQHDLYIVVPQMIVAGYLIYICLLKLEFWWHIMAPLLG